MVSLHRYVSHRLYQDEAAGPGSGPVHGGPLQGDVPRPVPDREGGGRQGSLLRVSIQPFCPWNIYLLLVKTMSRVSRTRYGGILWSLNGLKSSQSPAGIGCCCSGVRLRLNLYPGYDHTWWFYQRYYTTSRSVLVQLTDQCIVLNSSRGARRGDVFTKINSWSCEPIGFSDVCSRHRKCLPVYK